jgi:hypothetical protein
MKKFIITESEKERILNMHRNAIKRQYLKESEVEQGNVMAQAREQSLIDGTKGDITSIGFSIVGTPGQYYYNCVPSFDSKPEEIVGDNKAGAIYDGNFNLKTAAELGMTGNYTQEFKTACANIYTNLANKRKTFCVDPKNKTKPNFSWNCPQYTDEAKSAAAAAEASSQDAAQQEKLKAEKEAKIAATQAANTAAAEKARAEGDAVMGANALSFATPFNKLYNELMGLVEGTAESNWAMGTQQDIEAKINQLQEYWNANTKGKFTATNADEKTPYSVGKALRFIPRLIQTAKTKYPSMTATFVK